MMNRTKNGFTLVELLTALAVGLIIMSAIYAMVNLSQQSSAGIGRKVMTQQDARSVLDIMSMEIGMASFNPNKPPTAPWQQGNMSGSCSGIALKQYRKGIQVAGANTIGVAMDLDGSGSFCDGPNEYIVYSYDAANATITRNVNCSGAQIILGGDSSTMVRNNQTSPATPLFQYFNAAGNDISANVIANPDAQWGSGVTGIKDIRVIRINIVVDVVQVQQKQFQVSRRTYTTDTLVRNHAIENK